jgi:hypothetical protein
VKALEEKKDWLNYGNAAEKVGIDPVTVEKALTPLVERLESFIKTRLTTKRITSELTIWSSPLTRRSNCIVH